MKVRFVKPAGGHHRIPEKELDRFVHRASEGGDVCERRRNFRRISSRNQLVGLVAQVTISIGSQRITSIITADAIREMHVKNDQTVAALVKSTEVMIQK